jgi:mono/diheme cytochrome c family protein
MPDKNMNSRMRRTPAVAGLAVLLAAAAGSAGYRAPAAQSAAPAPAVTAGTPDAPGVPSRALLDRYCVSCHNQRTKAEGRPAFDEVDLGQIGTHAPVLEKIVRKLRSGQMPPDGSRRPDQATLDAFVTALETALDREGARQPDPGRVASRRLNRVEYVYAIQDLLGLEIDGTALLPSDMAGFGFDNNADVLSITPALMSRYAAAATKISRAAIGSPDNRPVQQVYSLGFEQQDARMGEEMPFATHGGLSVRHLFPLDGEYVFAIRMKGSEGGGITGIEDEHEIELRLDHALVKRFTIGGKFKGPDPGTLISVPEDDSEGRKIHEYRLNADKALEIRVPVSAGTRLVAVAFSDSTPSPLDGAYGRPGIDKVMISGPFNGTVPTETPSRQRIFSCRPASSRDEEPCARQILRALTRQAYRRPVTDRDIDPLLAVYREGRRDRDFDAGVERSLEALLSMPEFLLRVEREPAGVGAGRAYRLTDLELASRLSFFLWRSLPDEELIEVAARGQLREDAMLARQVRRMLADRRATRFMNDFVGQWLQVRNIHGQAPDGALFAGFNDTLRRAMVRETELFFESQVREDRPIPDLLRADYSYLNEQLARHYGVPGIYGSRFRRVTWPDDRRQGLLGHASVLTVTSYANRTSVVLRGKWVLETLLGAPPPPPPPNVPPLPANDNAKPTSLRERMQQHRSNPVCASCHTKMDPLGFALEHFDAVGRWRETDGGAAIDATINLDGSTVDSPKAFREALLGRGNEVVHTVAEKLLTYALGRGVEYYDAPTVRRLVRDLARDEYRWSSLVLGIVRSDAFQMRRAAASPAETARVVAAAAPR